MNDLFSDLESQPIPQTKKKQKVLRLLDINDSAFDSIRELYDHPTEIYGSIERHLSECTDAINPRFPKTYDLSFETLYMVLGLAGALRELSFAVHRLRTKERRNKSKLINTYVDFIN